MEQSQLACTFYPNPLSPASCLIKCDRDGWSCHDHLPPWGNSEDGSQMFQMIEQKERRSQCAWHPPGAAKQPPPAHFQTCCVCCCFLRGKKWTASHLLFKVTGIWAFCFMYLDLILVDIKKRKRRKPKGIGHRTTNRTGQGERDHHLVRDEQFSKRQKAGAGQGRTQGRGRPAQTPSGRGWQWVWTPIFLAALRGSVLKTGIRRGIRPCHSLCQRALYPTHHSRVRSSLVLSLAHTLHPIKKGSMSLKKMNETFGLNEGFTMLDIVVFMGSPA